MAELSNSFDWTVALIINVVNITAFAFDFEFYPLILHLFVEIDKEKNHGYHNEEDQDVSESVVALLVFDGLSDVDLFVAFWGSTLNLSQGVGGHRRHLKLAAAGCRFGIGGVVVLAEVLFDYFGGYLGL